jgi:ATP/ADP translocase
MSPGPHFVLKRVAMAAATAFLAINIWTGAPLFALWVGSQVVGKTTLSMKAVFVVVVVLAVLVFAMAMALAWLNASYDRLIGRPPHEPRMTWMRSMRAEDEKHDRHRVGVTALEQIVMGSVYLAVISLLVWFFFLAHYSFG